MSQPDTLNAVEVGELLYADAETVLILARRGDLPGTRIGKSWVFLRADVLNFLQERIAADTAVRKQGLRHAPVLPTAVILPEKPSRRRVAPIPLPPLPPTPKAPLP